MGLPSGILGLVSVMELLGVLTQRACTHSEGLHSEGLQKHLLSGVKKEALDSFQRSTGPVNQGASQGQPRVSELPKSAWKHLSGNCSDT